MNPRREEVREVLEHARERGELGADADLESAVNMLIGSYYAQYLAGMSFREDWPEAAVETVLAGLRRMEA